jgi:hypothetical protein
VPEAPNALDGAQISRNTPLGVPGENQIFVLPNFDAMLQGFEEDSIIHWQSLDERKWNASTIGKNEALVLQVFDNNRLIQTFGDVPKSR